MRKLIWLVVILTLGYAGYWFYGSSQIEAGAKAMLTQARQDGWGDAKGVTMAGFPSRFDLTYEEPQLFGADGAWSWSAPYAQVFALGYAPNKVISYLPSGQKISLGDQSYTLNLADMRSSVTVGYSTTLPLENLVTVIQKPVLTPDAGTAPELSADQLRLAITREDKAQGALPDPQNKGQLIMPGATYRLGAEAVNLTLPPALVAKLAPKSGLGDTVARLHLDALAGLRDPITKEAADHGVPGLMTFALSDLSLSWGGNDLSVAGNLRIDASGYPEGTLQIRSASWRNWISIAQGAGLIASDQVNLISGVATMLAAKDPQDALEIPLIFQNGQMSLGPIPLGPAPQFPQQQG
ncbi:DUF2125 domain-containing protein [Thioclava indica]|uniref:DUF2125 domain-containing protein n=1 Tax=Thioclava indica TaxID=1353528 RepID=A0A074JYP1_9RHOB|nr:DUF2125 domain-containing protein [Thioclava indica]KEO60663.1 hypothetical protein DT23_13160 [Thioclava indica]